ncbi:MAG TPA: IclR family transcriptional regulator [Arthrobacter sp.]|nr:IclR family transcriptional regulator [Arthrobacter sp.]
MPKQRIHRKKPAYPVESVDHALALVEMLRDFGTVRLGTAAAELGVSRSTAHRLMAMLVYSGFAEQDASRHYVPGPSLGVAPAGVSWTAELRRRVQPHLDLLAGRLDEAVNLVVRAGTEVRFLATVEGTRPLRVGDRRGAVMPADRASGGKAILAAMDPAKVEQLYRAEASMAGTALDEVWFAALAAELAGIRSTGFAANFEGTEDGVSALGVALHDGVGELVAGLTVAGPQQRFRRVFDGGLPGEVLRARDRVEAELEDFVAGGG